MNKDLVRLSSKLLQLATDLEDSPISFRKNVLSLCEQVLAQVEEKEADVAITLDEWIEKHAKELSKEIEIHISESATEDLHRVIMTSIRQHHE